MSLPVVQTKIGEYLTEKLRKDYKADINVEQVAISIFGGVKLRGILIRDHHKLPMITAKSIKTNILSFEKLYNGDLLFGEIRVDSLFFNLKTYKSEKDTNIWKFADLFDDGKPTKDKFLMKSKNVYITNSTFILSDENSNYPIQLNLNKLNIETSNLKIYGPEVATNILKMSFLDHRGISVENLKTNFEYTLKHIKLEQLSIITKNSFLNGNAILNYNENDFADFNNKVEFDVKLDSASIASNDIRFFYKELGSNQQFKIKSNIRGTLNDLYFYKLNLVDRNTKINGNINLKNLLGSEQQSFYMNGKFNSLSSNYSDLVSILPNILGNNLPKSLNKFGQFDFRGKTEITPSTLSADFYMTTSLGSLQSNLVMTNIDNIDNAAYKGNLILEQFKIGQFLDKKDIDFVTLNFDFDGQGLKLDNLNTSLSGDVYKLNYKGYNYTNIVVNGKFKNPIFQGKLNVNDPNLFMDFDGLVNLEKKEINYNFNANIDFANLKKLNLVEKDSISVFKGNIEMIVSGKNLDDFKGSVNLYNISYQNPKDTYYFDDFSLNSSFDERNIRTISINSPDIVQGKIVGNFQMDQLQYMLENSLGSLYANYKPNKIKKDQFLKFDFSIYNKIIDIFLPGVSLAPNTLFQGSINSDKNDIKFNFNSPKITAFDTNIHKISIRVDNKNPLYNTYVSMDSVQSDKYKISDFNLINVIENDTLFVRSEFKGGKKAEDVFKINVFHTINKQNFNVVGIQKSEIKFKEVLWYLNENSEDSNKIVFDKRLSNFSFDDIALTHKNEKVEFKGFVNDKNSKDLNLIFTNIDVNKLTPEISDFTFKGILNGSVNLKQNNNIYQPTASIFTDNLSVNNVLLGKLNLDISGDNELKKFNVNSTIVNENLDSFSAIGEFNIENEETKTNLDLRFNKFNLGVLGLIGGDIVTNIKGYASGSTNIEGVITDLKVNGRMYLEDSGISIPYLNVNYEFDKNSIVDITENSFIIRNASISDSKFKSQGKLDGRIKHNKFSDWILDLKVKSDRFLALDTKDSEDAAYFGTAFINGIASISGPSDGLVINIDAKSEKGTAIKIPINDVNASGTNEYIHFLTSKEKYNNGIGLSNNSRNYNGLELKFNLDINQKAEIEVILNRNSGHGMKGRGNGNLLLEINTLGKFIMTGDFQVYEGTYNFKYGGLIDKKFKVKKFGSIVWEGDPLKANINLEAVYETTANPAVLLDNPSINKKVPVDVIIGIKGNLSNVEPDFSINFPTVSSVLKSEIQYKLDDRDTRQKQALYLLSSGGFLSQLGISQTDLTGNIFEKFSGIFNDIFQDEEGKFNLGIDYVLADRRPGSETDGRFGVTVSSKINDRITFNGKLGVPIGGINQSAVVGDVEVQYRVNEDGTLNLRVFNKENDITFIGQNIGYTQGLGISYEIDFNTFKELVNKIFKKKILAPKITNSINQSDSDIPSDGINFKSKKNKPKKNTKANSEAILNNEID